MVMEPTDFRHGDHLAPVWREDWTRHRTLYGQRQVRSPLMIIGKVVGQDVSQMSLVQDDKVLKTLATNTPNQAL
jgi:hypothetical protein